MRVPNPEPHSHLPPRTTIPLGHPSAPAPSIQYHALNLDWRFVSYMILYMFQCHSLKSSHPFPLPQSPKDCSIHLCLFGCLPYRVIVNTFLNSIYMRQYTVLMFFFLAYFTQAPVSSTSLELIQMYSFQWLNNTPLCICTTAFLYFCSSSLLFKTVKNIDIPYKVILLSILQCIKL